MTDWPTWLSVASVFLVWGSLVFGVTVVVAGVADWLGVDK